MAVVTRNIIPLTNEERARFWSRVDKRGPTECWLWTAWRWPSGYGRFTYQKTSYRANRVAWFLQYGPIPEGVVIAHHCDTPACVNVLHLAAMSPAENIQDAARKGRRATGNRHPMRLYPERLPRGDQHWSHRMPQKVNRGNQHYSRLRPETLARGEHNGAAKLTTSKVQTIRTLLQQGMNRGVLAVRYEVNKSTIDRIATGKYWRHVPARPEVARG